MLSDGKLSTDAVYEGRSNPDTRLELVMVWGLDMNLGKIGVAGTTNGVLVVLLPGWLVKSISDDYNGSDSSLDGFLW